MAERISGRCACGGINYATTANPDFTLICHCRQCQRISGSGHAAQFAVPVKETRVEGAVKFSDQIADSGNTVSSGFCKRCGSPMLTKTTKMPDTYFFHAATLDDPSIFVPQFVVYEEAKPPWDHVDESIARWLTAGLRESQIASPLGFFTDPESTLANGTFRSYFVSQCTSPNVPNKFIADV